MTLKEKRLELIKNKLKEAVRQCECDLEELADLTEEDLKELEAQ